jgi:hypothetical protein
MSRALQHRLAMCWWILTNRPIATVASWDEFSGYELQIKFRKYRKEPFPVFPRKRKGPTT